jgi:2'-5' RNA ligase
MIGIVSLLDEEHYHRVENLWDEVEDRFNLEDIAPTPIPHLSYQVAGTYNQERLEPILHRIAKNTAPFQIQTTGLGIFTGADPVLYTPVVRTPALSAFQRLLWHELGALGSELSPYYHPDNWVPHITVADDNVDHARLPDLIRYLSTRNFKWTIDINNLSLIHDTNQGKGLYLRVDFG